jgi:hypothetical protein
MRNGRPPRLVWRDENHVVTLLGSAVGSDGHDAVSSELVSLESLAVNVGMDDRVRPGRVCLGDCCGLRTWIALVCFE